MVSQQDAAAGPLMPSLLSGATVADVPDSRVSARAASKSGADRSGKLPRVGVVRPVFAPETVAHGPSTSEVHAARSFSLPTYAAGNHAQAAGAVETSSSQRSQSPSGRNRAIGRIMTGATLAALLGGVILVSTWGQELLTSGTTAFYGIDHTSTDSNETTTLDEHTKPRPPNAEGNSPPVSITSTNEPAETVRDVPDILPRRPTNLPAPSDRTPAAPVGPSEPLSNSELVRRCEPSVCMVRTSLGSMGTGFVIAPGIVATNEHVIGLSNISNVVIQFPNRPDDRAYPVSLGWAVPGHDLVLLRARDLPSAALPLPIAKLDRLQKGDRLIVIGHPGGLPYVVTEGLFGSVQIMDGEEFLQLSMSVNPGNSGGPALTTRGQVAGVVTLKSSQHGIGLAITGDLLDEALKELETTKTAVTETRLKRWRSRQTGSRFIAGCSLCSELIDLYLASGIKSADKTSLGVRVDQTEEVQERLDRLSQLIREFSEKEDTRTGLHLSDEERQIIGQLATCFEVLDRHASRPEGPFNKLQSETAEQLQQWPQLKQRLDSTLGLMGLESEISANIGR